MEVVVRGNRRRGIVPGSLQTLVGRSERLERGVVERRRLAHGEALQHDHRRVEPPRLGHRKGDRSEHAVGDALDEAVLLQRLERRRRRLAADAEPNRHCVHVERLVGAEDPDEPSRIDLVCSLDGQAGELRRPCEQSRERDARELLRAWHVLPELEDALDVVQRFREARHCLGLAGGQERRLERFHGTAG